MRRTTALLMLVLLAGACLAASPAEAHWRGRLIHRGYYGYHGAGWYHPFGFSFHYSPLRWAPSVHPKLAIVDTDISPGHTRLYLDGEFIGTADHFDGFPDYLYLGPGSYTLECKLGGYTDQKLELEVETLNHYQIDLRMDRLKGEPRESFWDRARGPEPLVRVFESSSPVADEQVSTRMSRPGGGPDLRLRPDLMEQPRHQVERDRGGPESPGAPTKPRTEATLSFKISPSHAAVYLDGSFIGTAGELERSNRPMLIAPGTHTLEILAPGTAPLTRSLELAPGETLQIALDTRAE